MSSPQLHELSQVVPAQSESRNISATASSCAAKQVWLHASLPTQATRQSKRSRHSGLSAQSQNVSGHVVDMQPVHASPKLGQILPPLALLLTAVLVPLPGPLLDTDPPLPEEPLLDPVDAPAPAPEEPLLAPPAPWAEEPVPFDVERPAPAPSVAA